MGDQEALSQTLSTTPSITGAVVARGAMQLLRSLDACELDDRKDDEELDERNEDELETTELETCDELEELTTDDDERIELDDELEDETLDAAITTDLVVELLNMLGPATVNTTS